MYSNVASALRRTKGITTNLENIWCYEGRPLSVQFMNGCLQVPSAEVNGREVFCVVKKVKGIIDVRE